MLIQTKNTVYICELKAKQKIDTSVITEVKDKIKKIKISKNISVRTVLIYAGQIDIDITEQDYFDKIVNFKDVLKPHI